MATGQLIDAGFRITRAGDGHLRWFQALGDAERDSVGDLIALSGTVADVTAIVAAELDARRAH